MAKIDEYLLQALKGNASDLHFISGDPVRARVHGGLKTMRDEMDVQAHLAAQLCFCRGSHDGLTIAADVCSQHTVHLTG